MANPFTAKTAPSMMPSDWDSQQRQIDYERKLAERLAGDTEMPQGGMVGHTFVGPSWTQMLAKALNPMWAQKHRESADRQARTLGDERIAERTGTLERYGKALQGQPEQQVPNFVMQPDAEGQIPTATQPAVAGSRDAAMAELGKSRDPGLQQLYMAQMLKGLEPSKFGNTPHYDQSGKAYVLDERGTVKYLDGVGQREKIVADNMGGTTQYRSEYSPTPVGQAFHADPNKPFAMTPGGMVPNAPFQEYEKSKATAGANRVQTNVNAYMPASEAAQKDFMDKSAKTFEALQTAPVALANIEKAKALVTKAGGLVGSGGETKLETIKFFNNNLGTNIAPDQVKSAEELRSRLFMQIMDNLKKMDAQPSQQQQKVMQEALGNLGTDPGAIPRVLDAFGDTIKGKVAVHNKTVSDAEKRGVKFPYDPRVDMALPGGVSPAAPANGGGSNVDDLLKKYGG